MNRKPWNLRAIVFSISQTLVLVAAPLFAQAQLKVSGTVSDPAGEVLIGVSVSVKGKPTLGTSTNIDGRYTLNDVPEDGTLIFSYVGFKAQEIAVKGRNVVDAVLHENQELILFL